MNNYNNYFENNRTEDSLHITAKRGNFDVQRWIKILTY